MNDVVLHHVGRIDFTLTAWDWPFARERRAKIDAFWTALTQANPKLWNGRVLLLKSFAVDGGLCRGAFFETDFAAFAAWKRWGFQPAGAYNAFAMGALRSADGAFLLGQMALHTLNAGEHYFPCGTPDRDDIRGDRVDLWGSVTREVAEETGVSEDDYAPGHGWTIVEVGAQIAFVRVLQLALPANAMRKRICNAIAREEEPELADIVIVRGLADLSERMPPYVTVFLKSQWP